MITNIELTDEQYNKIRKEVKEEVTCEVTDEAVHKALKDMDITDINTVLANVGLFERKEAIEKKIEEGGVHLTTGEKRTLALAWMAYGVQ